MVDLEIKVTSTKNVANGSDETSAFSGTDTNEESEKYSGIGVTDETITKDKSEYQSFKSKVEEKYQAAYQKISRMREPRAYILFEGRSVSGLLIVIRELLVEKKNMDIQELCLADGSILLQSRTKKGYLKQFTGLDCAITVHIKDYKNGQIEIYISESKWMDKAFATTLVSFIFWPLLVVPGIGSYKQIALMYDIYKLLDNYFALE